MIKRIGPKYICPRCGKRSMVRVRNPRGGGYLLICLWCKAKRGPLPFMTCRAVA